MIQIVDLKGAAAVLNVGMTFLCALKKAAGIKSRKFDLNRLVEYWRANPDFKQRDVYSYPNRRGLATGQPCRGQGRRVEVVDTCGEPS